MICKICELEFGDLSQNIGTCPECLLVIIANSIPEPTCERCDVPIGDGKGCKPRLCTDCTNDDFDGDTCEECGSSGAKAEDDGICPECRDKEAERSAEPDEPEEEDLVTEDYEHFYIQGGGGLPSPAVRVPNGDDWRPHVKAYMDRVQFWPSVWFVSDHGNAHLLSLEEPQ